MSETPEQYIRRILSNVADSDPWAILSSTSTRLRELTAGQPPERITRKPAPDRWSAAEILAHLADSEVVAGWRLRSILAWDGVPLQPFDQNRWAVTFKYDQLDWLESIELFDAGRRGNLRLLRAVDEELFENYGLHAERGRETVAHLLRLYAGHDLNHVHQVEQLLA